ncbi:MAG: tetratricopeptide repeat protein [Phycisphaerae bacterium]
MGRYGVVGVLLALAVGGCATATIGELNQQGLAELRAGRYAQAQAYFKLALEKEPERAETLYYLGCCALERARQKLAANRVPPAMRYLDDAISWFDSAIESAPGYAAAQEAKVEALELKGRYEQALAAAKWADRFVGPAARQKIILGRHYERIGDMDEALLCYRQAVAIEPDSSLARAELGRFYARLGRKQEAILELRKAYRMNPAEPGVVPELQRLGGLASTQPSR